MTRRVKTPTAAQERDQIARQASRERGIEARQAAMLKAIRARMAAAARQGVLVAPEGSADGRAG